MHAFCMHCIAGNFCGGFNLANLQIFYKLPKLIPPNMRAHAFTHRTQSHIARNGVACGAHVFAKLKFADQFANFNARQNNRLYGIASRTCSWWRWLHVQVSQQLRMNQANKPRYIWSAKPLYMYLTVHIICSDKVIHSAHEYWPKPTIGLYAAEL